MTRLLIARHGETAWNRLGRWQGFANQRLNDLGRRQAAALAARLALDAPGALYASDLARAVETADAVARSTGLDLVTDPRLREIDVGGWSGMSRAEIAQTYPVEYRQWELGTLDRYPDGESFDSLRRRTAAAFADIVRRHGQSTVAVVCHGGTIRSIVAEHLAMPADGHRLLATGPNGSVTVLQRRHDRLVLLTYNDASHLPADG